MSGPPPPGAAPSEEELRAAYEAELARITATDMIAQAAVSLLNIGARRMGPPGAAEQAPPGMERDLEQVRDAIDAAMALIGVLGRTVPAEQLSPLRDALSRLQMAYAAEVGGAGPADEGGPDDGPGDGGPRDGGGDGPGDPPPGGTGGGAEPDPGAGGAGQQPGPGPAESSGRLWVPGR
jgi:hypothetical protein